MLVDGIGCCIRMVVRRAAPSSLRMIIRSIGVEAIRKPRRLRRGLRSRLGRLVGYCCSRFHRFVDLSKNGLVASCEVLVCVQSL